jgi:xanthine dehydrogenase accessory factor
MSPMTHTKTVVDTIDDWVAEGERVAVATVVDTKKSAPQPPGTKMALGESGRVAGAVSGGCVEGAVVEVAERVIAGEEPALLHYGVADDDAWDVGLPCGGEVSVFVERYEGLQVRFHSLTRSGARAALVTALQGPPASLGAKLLVLADGATEGTLGDAALDAAAVELAGEALWTERSERVSVLGAGLFVDVIAPPPRLVVFGAVDFAAQLAEVARLAGWRTFVIDPRARFATVERFPAAERVIPVWPTEGLAQIEPLDRASAVAVLTHDPKLDDAALTAALASEAGYIGAMGSRRAQAKRRERLLAAGVDESELTRISAPIGLDIGALTAAETAISIMAEITALRRGRTGGRLGDARGRIHDAVSA